MDASTNKPVINITGEWVALGPIREDLLPLYERWENDFEVLRTHIQEPLPMTAEVMRRWFERVRTGTERIPFTVYEREKMQPIGLSGLMGVDFRNRTAEFNISIAEAGFRGRGYGTETARLVLDYAFSALGLRSAMLTAVDYNYAGLRVYEKIGFREIGRRREAFLAGGQFRDIVYMDILASEFESPVLVKVFDAGGSADKTPEEVSS
jgi:RimJ/RimL family protein N-acetyltransferase